MTHFCFWDALDLLSDHRSRTILIARSFYVPYRHLGKALKLSAERIRQVESTAWRHLRCNWPRRRQVAGYQQPCPWPIWRRKSVETWTRNGRETRFESSCGHRSHRIANGALYLRLGSKFFCHSCGKEMCERLDLDRR